MLDQILWWAGLSTFFLVFILTIAVIVSRFVSPARSAKDYRGEIATKD